MDPEDAGIESGETSQESAPVGTSESTGQETGGNNPAWSEILNSLPDSLHSVVRPALEKWDRNYESGIQKVHSQYEPYKPLIEAGYEPQSLQYAMQVMQMLENDPRSIYDSLAEHYGYNAAEQGQSETDDADESYDGENEVDPRVLRAEQMSEAVAQYIMEQHQAQQEQAEDEALDQEISGLREKHGIDPGDEVADRFVMGLMLAGASAEEAFTEYVNMQQAAATRPRANDRAPVVLGSGGGVPSSAIPANQLRDPKTRRALVAQMLQQEQ